MEIVSWFLISLEMPFNFGEKSLVNVCPLSELFQNWDLLLETFISRIHTIQQIGHITEHDRVEPNADKHPHDGKEPFVHVLSWDVSEADSSQGLKCPVKWL